MNIKILSLDFDGTLVYPAISTEEIYYRFIKDKIPFSNLKDKFKTFETEYLTKKPELKNEFRNLGRLSKEDRIILYYRWNKERLNYILPNLTHKEKSNILKKIMNQLGNDESLKFFPEVKDVLSYCKNKKLSLYILSGNNKQYIKDFLKINDSLDMFDDILTPDSLQMDKKDIFLTYKEKNVDFSEIIHIGDDPELDFQRPTSLGIHSFWLKRENTRYKDEKISNDYIIRNLAEIKSIL